MISDVDKPSYPVDLGSTRMEIFAYDGFEEERLTLCRIVTDDIPMTPQRLVETFNQLTNTFDKIAGFDGVKAIIRHGTSGLETGKRSVDPQHGSVLLNQLGKMHAILLSGVEDRTLYIRGLRALIMAGNVPLFPGNLERIIKVIGALQFEDQGLELK